MPTTRPMTILVIDDDADTRANLTDVLELDGYRVLTAGSVAETLDRERWDEIDAILLDRRLPDGTAEDLLPRLRQLAPEAAVLVVTGYADLQGAIAALRHGAFDYALKPIQPDALRASLARVAERVALRRAMQQSEAAFRKLVEAAPSLIVILRADHRIAFFNPFAERLTGFAAVEVLGRDYLELFLPEESWASAAERIRRVFAGHGVRGLESRVRCKDGSSRWVIWNAEFLDDYQGGPALLAVGQDITGLKEAQEQALQAERLAAIGQMMTGLAHESGNALARSQAVIELLALEVPDQPEVQKLLARLQQAQQHLQQLYEEVRGYAAPVRLERQHCDLGRVWRQAWEHLALRRQGRDALLLERSDDVDLVCDADPFRLDQVFRNIFENALAACKDPVRIEVSCSEVRLGGRAALRLSVRDNGPGLSPEARRRIFEPFFTTKTKGTGLGMAIARRVIEAHGGRIAVGDGDGAGAEIVLVLPREQR